jgi:hypothetical protein
MTNQIEEAAATNSLSEMHIHAPLTLDDVDDDALLMVLDILEDTSYDYRGSKRQLLRFSAVNKHFHKLALPYVFKTLSYREAYDKDKFRDFCAGVERFVPDKLLVKYTHQ